MAAKIILVGGIKGGTGKSTISANLAVLSARSGRETLLVDTDDQQTTMTWAAARGEREGVTSVTTIYLSGKQARPELLRLSEKYDTVIIDAGARDTTTQRAAMSVAETVLLPFPPRGPDLWTLDAVEETIKEIRSINAQMRALLFVNRAEAVGDDNREAEEAFAEYAETFERLPVRVGNRKGIASAHLMGLGACEAKRPDVKAVSELEALFRYVVDTATVQAEHRDGIE